MELPPLPGATVGILDLAGEPSPKCFQHPAPQTATNRVVALQHQKTEHLVECPVVAKLSAQSTQGAIQPGKRIAARNLWLSIPALLLSFSVWMVWSVVVAKLPQVGFDYTTDQLF